MPQVPHSVGVGSVLLATAPVASRRRGGGLARRTFGAEALQDAAAGAGDVEERGAVKSFGGYRFGACEPLGLGGPTT